MEWPAAGIVPEPWCWLPVNVDPMLGAAEPGRSLPDGSWVLNWAGAGVNIIKWRAGERLALWFLITCSCRTGEQAAVLCLSVAGTEGGPWSEVGRVWRCKMLCREKRGRSGRSGVWLGGL